MGGLAARERKSRIEVDIVEEREKWVGMGLGLGLGVCGSRPREVVRGRVGGGCEGGRLKVEGSVGGVGWGGEECGWRGRWELVS